MIEIDYIMKLLDWNNSEEEQAEGIALARNVQSINVFLQPHDEYNNKNVWDNCAKILAERGDDELAPYLSELMEWLQDLNWPGAFCIIERLNQYSNDSWYHKEFNYSLKCARATRDGIWVKNLKLVKKAKRIFNKKIKSKHLE